MLLYPLDQAHPGLASRVLIGTGIQQPLHLAGHTSTVTVYGNKQTQYDKIVFEMLWCRDHYVSPQQFGANVDKMAQTAKQRGVRWFVFVTPPPVCESCKGKSPVSPAASLIQAFWIGGSFIFITCRHCQQKQRRTRQQTLVISWLPPMLQQLCWHGQRLHNGQ